MHPYQHGPTHLVPVFSRRQVTIDTLPPEITGVYSTAKGGNYTAGDYIDIVVKFSKDVSFSPLPDIYSQVRRAPSHPPPILLPQGVYATHIHVPPTFISNRGGL